MCHVLANRAKLFKVKLERSQANRKSYWEFTEKDEITFLDIINCNKR